MILETDRLIMKPLLAKHLLALIASDDQFCESFGMPAAEGFRGFYVSDEIAPEWLEQLHDPTLEVPWTWGFALIPRDQLIVAGLFGFTGPPDMEGMIEIGYGVVPSFQRRGFATEATRAGTAFAFADERVRLARAHTLPVANASTRVLENCGFDHVDTVIEDQEDGLVWRWERFKGDELEARCGT